ncbi:MAG: heavy-metal-associated domain-containing protein [Clostridiales bacterium]|jgi:copper chaperone CopZ|nr:heavy-metal-associated domain-containing protein [Eubacteriales bacterium]MDH7566727.1 heavy-metal-associated domain-containing protein [Clostridiales bacterium]
MKANKFIISGLNDPGKIPNIEQSILSRSGINAVRVDMQGNTVTVDYDEGRYSEGDIKNFVTQTGLTVIKVK